MRHKKEFLKAVRQAFRRITWGYYGLLAFLICPVIAMADNPPSGDLLAPAASEVSSTFGTGSTLWIIIYTLEILAAGYSFILKKNLPAFLGVVALIIFTTVAALIIPKAT